MTSVAHRRRWLLAAAVPAVLAACTGPDGATGPSGSDGYTYLAVTWVSGGKPVTASFSDSRLPSTLTLDQYYLTAPGYYTFSYTAWDYSRWSGNYTLSYNPGQPGSPGTKGGSFGKKGKDGSPGADGQDLYYTLRLYSIGPSISRSSAMASVATRSMIEESSSADVATREGIVEERQYNDGPWRIVLRYWQTHAGDPATHRGPSCTTCTAFKSLLQSSQSYP
ncbi:MAG: hypothetical protein WC700_04530 [Gemmatimonadaceae bacterium]